MRRIVAFAALMLLLACMWIPVAGVGSYAEEVRETVTLYVYNWGEYISDGSEGCMDVNAEFENYFNENLAQEFGYKVKVNYSTYSSNADMYAKVSSGAVAYDVIIPSDYMIERMAEEGLLHPLNFDNIPNFEENILDEFKNPEYDPENRYSVPYCYGMVGIIYNANVVDEDDPDIGSWKLMFNEDSPYRHDILQFNNSRDAFGTAQYYLGFDVNDENPENWRAALELLKKQKSIVQGYVMDEIFNKMKSGSAAISAYYAGDYLSMYEDEDEDVELEFFYPREGTNYYVDAFCVPYNSAHPELAEAYINYMLSEEPAVANAEYTYYASPNKLVLESEEYIECMSEIKENAMEILYGEPEEGYLKTTYRNLLPEGIAQMNNLWEELKVESSVGTAIYVICIVILAVILGFTLFFVIRKRIRAI